MESATAVQPLPVDQIKSAPYQARTDFDPESIVDLAGSMQGPRGLIQPITVRQLPDGTLELIAGERRLRAAKSLGWSAINALVLHNVSDQDAASMGLIENLQRKDLNPIERAKGYKRLMDDFKMSHDDIAKSLGLKDNSAVSRHLALLQMPQEIQDLLPRGSISETHCRAIRKIPDQNEQIRLAKQAAAQDWSVKETEKQVAKFLNKPEKGGESGQEDSKTAAPDPFADYWYALGLSPAVAPKDSWTASYKPDGWHFHAKSSLSAPELVRWFQKIGEVLGTTLATTSVIQEPIAVAPPTLAENGKD